MYNVILCLKTPFHMSHIYYAKFIFYFIHLTLLHEHKKLYEISGISHVHKEVASSEFPKDYGKNTHTHVLFILFLYFE